MRALSKILLAGAVASVAVPLTAVPASAAPGGCKVTYLCVYRNTFYDDGPFQFAGANRSWSAWPRIANDDSSWFNNGTSGLAAAVYDARDFQIRTICLERGTGNRIALSKQDRGSSNRWLQEC
jgi:hypothetical protein